MRLCGDVKNLLVYLSRSSTYCFTVAIDLIVHHISEILHPSGQSAKSTPVILMQRRPREH